MALARVGLADRAARGPQGRSRTVISASWSSSSGARGDPNVILLDEPMAGVSAEDVDGLMALIGSVHREESKTILLVEHPG